MTEPFASVGPDGTVFLSDGREATPMSALDAMRLAKDLMMCAVASHAREARVGAVPGDMHIPVTRCAVEASPYTDWAALTFTFDPPLQFTLRLTPKVVADLLPALERIASQTRHGSPPATVQ